MKTIGFLRELHSSNTRRSTTKRSLFYRILMKIFQIFIQLKFRENSLSVSQIVTRGRIDMGVQKGTFVHLSFTNTSKNLCRRGNKLQDTGENTVMKRSKIFADSKDQNSSWEANILFCKFWRYCFRIIPRVLWTF